MPLEEAQGVAEEEREPLREPSDEGEAAPVPLMAPEALGQLLLLREGCAAVGEGCWDGEPEGLRGGVALPPPDPDSDPVEVPERVGEAEAEGQGVPPVVLLGVVVAEPVPEPGSSWVAVG